MYQSRLDMATSNTKPQGLPPKQNSVHTAPYPAPPLVLEAGADGSRGPRGYSTPHPLPTPSFHRPLFPDRSIEGLAQATCAALCPLSTPTGAPALLSQRSLRSGTDSAAGSGHRGTGSVGGGLSMVLGGAWGSPDWKLRGQSFGCWLSRCVADEGHVPCGSLTAPRTPEPSRSQDSSCRGTSLQEPGYRPGLEEKAWGLRKHPLINPASKC